MSRPNVEQLLVESFGREMWEAGGKRLRVAPERSTNTTKMKTLSRVNHRTRPGHLAVAKLVAALVEGPQTMWDLMDASGLNKTTVRGYLRHLYRQKAIHVAGWEQDKTGRLSLRAYKIGACKDVPKPKRQFDAAKYRRDLRKREKQMRIGAALAGLAA